MAGLGKWEEGWKESTKASVLLGTEEFVAGMLKELKGDRREQTGMREKGRLSLEWSRIVAAIAKSGKRPGKRCPAKEAMEQWVWRNVTFDPKVFRCGTGRRTKVTGRQALHGLALYRNLGDQEQRKKYNNVSAFHRGIMRNVS
jgi:hypothetical protein